MYQRLPVIAVLFAALLTGPVLADPPPAGFEPHKFNGPSAPVTEDGITTFHIEDEECSNVDFGDGRGESDCLNGSVRSMLRYERWAELGETLNYSMDILVEPGLEYEGYFNPDSAGFEPRGLDSHIRLASWEGTFLHNFLYILKLNGKTGITFAGEQCQAPEDFGQWVHFSMKVRWTGDNRGWIAVTCNDKYVYVAEGAPSNVSPHCYIQNQCVAGEVRSPRRILYIAGLQMAGWGWGWQDMGLESQFVKIQDGGITVRMRNMTVTPDPVLYGPDDTALVVELQEALNALGCDVGTADGALGQRTRQAAQTCRTFADGVMPDALNVATLQTFHDLYTGGGADGVVSDAAGEVAVDNTVGADGLLMPEHVIDVFADEIQIQDDQLTMVLPLHAEMGRFDLGFDKLDLLIIGRYSPPLENMYELRLLLEKGAPAEIGDALAKCRDIEAEDWGDGKLHVAFDLKLTDGNFIARGAECGIAALDGPLAAEARFVFANFADIALSLVANGNNQAIAHDGLPIFIEKVARGEVTVSD